MLPIDSPCTKVCTLHPRVAVCTGCGRTLSEIERWPRLAREERLALMDVVRDRLAHLQATGWQEHDPGVARPAPDAGSSPVVGKDHARNG